MGFSRWLVAALVVTTLGACKKDEAPASDPKPTDPAVKSADKPAEMAKPGDPAVAEAPPPMQPIKEGGVNVSDLALLPVDSDVVVGVNFAQAQQSPLWKEYISAKVMADDIKANLDELKKCGFDPMAVVKTASIGLKTTVSGGKEGVVIVHGPDKAKVLACADKLKLDAASKVEITKDGETLILKKKSGGDPIAIGFIDDSTALLVVGGKADAAGVKAAMGNTKGVKTSARFVDLYNKLDTSQSMWFLVNGKAKAFEALGAMGLKPKQVYGAVNLADGVVVDLRMRLENPDQATQFAATLKSQLGAAAGMLHLDKADATSDGSDLKLVLSVAAANVEALGKQMKAMAGAGGTGSP